MKTQEKHVWYYDTDAMHGEEDRWDFRDECFAYIAKQWSVNVDFVPTDCQLEVLKNELRSTAYKLLEENGCDDPDKKESWAEYAERTLDWWIADLPEIFKNNPDEWEEFLEENELLNENEEED